MPWRGPAYEGEPCSLGFQIAQWIQNYCVVPDRELRGQPFLFTEEQLRFLILYYRIDPEASRWFYARGGQLVRPQKWGKGPLAAAVTCAEAAGPVRFDGFDAQGEPVGKPWATPHIQVTACSEDQTANTWRALQPMIELGPLGEFFIPDTGLSRINLPGGGLIEPVTASARSRLGQRVSFAVQDETHAWVRSNHGLALADTQRRNLAGVGGRFLETTNAPDPVDQSVAQRTQIEPGVYIDDVDGGAGSVRNKAERRRVMRKVYGDSTTTRGGWVDLDRIDVEVEALLAHDPAQAERFFLNRKLAAEGAAFDPARWAALAKARRVEPNTVITLGIDGARHHDAIAVIATEVEYGYQWPVIILERPDNAPEDYEHDLDAVEGAVNEACERYTVWRAYADDQYISGLIEKWQNRFGEKRFVIWHTNRPRQIAWAVRRFEEALAAGDLSHDANPTFATHMRNSRKRMLTVLDDNERIMHTLSKSAIRSVNKIDAAMAAILSWEARSDALASGAVSLTEAPEQTARATRSPSYEPDFAPALSGLASAPGPMGDMS